MSRVGYKAAGCVSYFGPGQLESEQGCPGMSYVAEPQWGGGGGGSHNRVAGLQVAHDRVDLLPELQTVK